ncbi:hypothetical protein [Simkania sp.]|uniref:hypothetical protein n=1 Tax=Simkania sp. TaxID=34094 RepID=UPI003B527EB8
MATELQSTLPFDPKAMHIWVKLQTTLELCRFSNTDKLTKVHPRVDQIKKESFLTYPLWTAQLTLKEWEKGNQDHPYVKEVSTFARLYVSRIPNRSMPGTAFLLKRVEEVDSQTPPPCRGE